MPIIDGDAGMTIIAALHMRAIIGCVVGFMGPTGWWQVMAAGTLRGASHEAIVAVGSIVRIVRMAGNTVCISHVPRR